MKKIFSIVISIILAITSVGFISVYAENPEFEHKTEVPFGYTGIYTDEDLYKVYNGINYILMNDIDLSGVDKWAPLCNDYDGFSGVFDGNGFKIKNMKSVRGGLFGRIANAKIMNLGIVDCEINAYDDAGALANESKESEIFNCYCTGAINVNDMYADVGGIIGYNCVSENKISQCYSNVDITVIATNIAHIGGISGDYCEISDCFNSGNITVSFKDFDIFRPSHVGGIAGVCGGSDFSVKNCYNIGEISVEQEGVLTGQILGSCNAQYIDKTVLHPVTNATVTNCFGLNYYDLPLMQIGDVKPNGECKKLNFSEMSEKKSFTEFDFINTWFIDDSSGYSYPQLRNCPYLEKEHECISVIGEQSSPICTEESDAYYICSICHTIISHKIRPAENHDDGIWTIGTPSTCTTDGVKNCNCSKCGTLIDSEILPATGHSFGEWQVITNATCTENGIEKRACSQCGIEQTQDIKAPGHDFIDSYVIHEPTCSENGIGVRYCSQCRYEEEYVIPANEHIFSEPVTIIEPSEHTEGLVKCTCLICGYENIKQVEATGTTNHFMFGDIDGDGKVTASDARKVLRFAANMDDMMSNYIGICYEYAAADVNEDSHVTALDARLILRASVMLDSLPETSSLGYELTVPHGYQYDSERKVYSSDTTLDSGVSVKIYSNDGENVVFDILKWCPRYYTEGLTVNGKIYNNTITASFYDYFGNKCNVKITLSETGDSIAVESAIEDDNNYIGLRCSETLELMTK